MTNIWKRFWERYIQVKRIDYKIKGVNDGNGETQKEDEKTTQDGRKTANETQECDFQIHDHNRNDEEHHKNNEDTESEEEKNGEPKNYKEHHPNQREEENEKNEGIIILELQSKSNENKVEVAGKESLTRNR